MHACMHMKGGALIDGSPVLCFSASDRIGESLLALCTQFVTDGYTMPPPSNEVYGFASEDVLLGVSQQAIRAHPSRRPLRE